ncbi:MAG: class I SAM-dependent methyltransferase [Chthoniobacterales bacterium]
MKTARGKYQGVLQIIRFNWPMYVAAVAVLAAGSAVASAAPLPVPGRATIFTVLSLAAFWLVLSLLVSHYVYDRSALYAGHWLLPALGNSPARYATLHVGLDEFSEILKEKFPWADGSVIDFFDATEMTEASIQRARREHARDLPTAIRADSRALRFRDNEFDAVFLIFAAHELRRPASRQELLRELRRTLKPGGKIVLVEHLRDLANFLAFGPGFLHFHSRTEWLRNIAAANLSVVHEFRFTPFVRVLFLGKKA